MSQRSATATVSAILWAFLCERTWLQPALARRVGVSVRTLRGRLEELLANGVPLERQDDPPHVYWSVPRGWVPDGVVFKNDAAADVLRFVARCPRSAKRDALMQRLLCGQGGA